MRISCKEVRVENNQSFYGCFCIGPFDSSQSITVANALRRTLLSECAGLSIVSVKIQDVNHEYATLPGVKDSVMDIVFNLKSIILKKKNNMLTGHLGLKNKGINSIYDKVGKNFLKPIIGYLKVKGPGVIRAHHLQLPSSIQCINPNQYIATLSEDGNINLKFFVMEGQGYRTNKSNSNSKADNEKKQEYLSLLNINTPTEDSLKQSSNVNTISNTSSNALHASKSLEGLTKRYLNTKQNTVDYYHTTLTNRQNLYQTLRNYYKIQNVQNRDLPLEPLEHSTSVKRVSKTFKEVETRPELNQDKNNILEESQTKLTKGKYLNNYADLPNATELEIDAVFNPITKVNYVINANSNYEVNNLYEKKQFVNYISTFIDSTGFIRRNFPVLRDKWGNSDYLVQNLRQTQLQAGVGDGIAQVKKENNTEATLGGLVEAHKIAKQDLTKNEFKSIFKDAGWVVDSPIPESSSGCFKDAESLELLQKSLKHIFGTNLNRVPSHWIDLEIYTNGSIHPRIALINALDNLCCLFSIHNR